MALRHLRRWLQLDYTPGGGVRSRRECEAHYGEEWSILIAQERMTREHASNAKDWFLGTAPCDLLLPQIVVAPQPSEGNAAAPAALSRSEDSVDAVSESSDSVPDVPGAPTPATALLVGSIPVTCPLVTDRPSAVLSPPTSHTGAPTPPAASASRVNTLCRLALGVHPGDLTWVPAVTSTAIQVSRTLVEGTRRATAQARGWIRAAVAVAERELCPPPALEELKPVAKGPRQEVGEAASWVNAESVAMELRALFGLLTDTPVHREMGGRVAREILRDRCRCGREDTWYLSTSAVTHWLSPTLTDLVLATRPQGFH
ncbi:hypothetical protein 1 [Changjiang tombus-like virus 3]|uniref:hypothetical protein 1 n=1 Tax=Changjiang tombus-like virus 3 TaxID=1922817 RepID=UPI00090AE386|nr:hypothetical protein 1 [Changjiang tombus-like virus 3]APG76250.1 hypothetical protein 1 [Changjiang tombus-like virus 3]